MIHPSSSINSDHPGKKESSKIPKSLKSLDDLGCLDCHFAAPFRMAMVTFLRYDTFAADLRTLSLPFLAGLVATCGDGFWAHMINNVMGSSMIIHSTQYHNPFRAPLCPVYDNYMLNHEFLSHESM